MPAVAAPDTRICRRLRSRGFSRISHKGCRLVHCIYCAFWLHLLFEQMSVRGPSAYQMTDLSTNRKAKVFVSYSRDDIDFADQLVAALEGTGFDALIDRHSIPGGEDWKSQLRHMIIEADSIVFALSPRSAASKLCEWEVEEADQHNKRLIPIVCASLEGVSVFEMN